VPLPVLAVVIGVVVAVTFGVLAATRSGGGAGADVALSLPRADAATDASLPSAASTTTLATTLHVHAAGAVQRPGVVEVPAGARVVDVVNAAGGAAGDADLNQINLAELVTDGERIYVPRAGEVVASIAGPASLGSGSGSGSSGSKDGGGIVNINEANATELESLPGVGPATAQAILDYRSEHGRFRSVDDLLNVRGIGPAKLEQIKPHARV
jgi:competence protein ComEA